MELNLWSRFQIALIISKRNLLQWCVDNDFERTHVDRVGKGKRTSQPVIDAINKTIAESSKVYGIKI